MREIAPLFALRTRRIGQPEKGHYRLSLFSVRLFLGSSHHAVLFVRSAISKHWQAGKLYA